MTKCNKIVRFSFRLGGKCRKSATSFLNHFIRISPKHGADRKELLAPNQDIYLRENIRLRLQLAIMAVPRQQNELYKQSLEAVHLGFVAILIPMLK